MYVDRLLHGTSLLMQPQPHPLLQVQLVDVLLGIAASLGEDWGEELVVEAVRQVRQA